MIIDPDVKSLLIVAALAAIALAIIAYRLWRDE